MSEKRETGVARTTTEKPKSGIRSRMFGRVGRPSPRSYLAITGLGVVAALGGIWQANTAFAPEMYQPGGLRAAVDAFERNTSFSVFDLNLNIRELRDLHIARMKKAPDVVILGASHWQEAHDGLVTHKAMFNAHVHRDYYEDILGVSEMMVRHDKLPRQMIISIRDKIFTPVAKRTDHLWLPTVPYYRAMTRRLGIEPHGRTETLPFPRWREQLSLPMLHANVTRWYTSPVKPHATMAPHDDTLDTLMADGSIVWSAAHMRLFKPDRTRQMAVAFATESAKSPPQIDPKGVAAVDAMLSYLRGRGVELFFVHPPFNPDFYARVRGTAYMDGLAAVEKLTQRLAEKHGAKIFGSFDPAKVGCETRMFIDAEHASPECLGKVLAQYVAMDKQEPLPVKPPVAQGPAMAAAPVRKPAHLSQGQVAGVSRAFEAPVSGVVLPPTRPRMARADRDRADHTLAPVQSTPGLPVEPIPAVRQSEASGRSITPRRADARRRSATARRAVKAPSADRMVRKSPAPAPMSWPGDRPRTAAATTSAAR